MNGSFQWELSCDCDFRLCALKHLLPLGGLSGKMTAKKQLWGTGIKDENQAMWSPNVWCTKLCGTASTSFSVGVPY